LSEPVDPRFERSRDWPGRASSDRAASSRRGRPDLARRYHGRPRMRVSLALIGILLGLSGCSASDDGNGSQKVNGSVHVAAGKPAAAAETVNGNIVIADDAAVTVASTVNGAVHLGAHGTANALNTINGSITVGSGAHVAQGAESVNGGMTVHTDAEVLGAVKNVNGKIELTGAHVAGGIKTVNGDISIMGPSHVEGGIFVRKKDSGFIHFGDNVPRIVIGPGATVQGDLRFEREVTLYVSDRATIGPVTGATPIRFTGDTPPAG
jgi:hypothetical protein